MFDKLLFDIEVVLDDAVVGDGDSVIAAEMRMSVCFRGRSVCRPARMPDAEATGQRIRFFVDLGRQGIDATSRLDDTQFALDGMGRDPGAVIAAVFESPQTLQQEFKRLLAADVANNSAHRCRSQERSIRHRALNWEECMRPIFQ